MSIQALRERLTIGPVAIRDKEHTSVAFTEIKAALVEVDSLAAQLQEANYRVTVHSDIAAENNLLRCQAEARIAEAEKAGDELYAQLKKADAEIAAAEARESELLDVLHDVWNQFAIERADGTKWAGGLSTLEEVERALQAAPENEEVNNAKRG